MKAFVPGTCKTWNLSKQNIYSHQCQYISAGGLQGFSKYLLKVPCNFSRIYATRNVKCQCIGSYSVHVMIYCVYVFNVPLNVEVAQFLLSNVCQIVGTLKNALCSI